MFKIIKKENLAPNIYLMDVVAPRIASPELPDTRSPDSS